jgi:hypothetical protein
MSNHLGYTEINELLITFCEQIEQKGRFLRSKVLIGAQTVDSKSLLLHL